MKFFKSVLLVLPLCLQVVVNGQAVINPAIESTLNQFIDYSNKQDWDKAFDLLYPKLFTKVAKQDLMDVMTGMEADGLSLQMANTHITSTSVPMKEGEETFVRVQYVSDLTVTIKSGGLYDYPKSIQAIEEQFKSIYGASNVKWDPGANQYHIVANKAMIAIQGQTGDWKLVEVNMDQPALMESLFSPAVMDALVRKE